jgi:ElaB/YqjD/DUF883 family membrane-anchored ribosome-binding protein
VDTQRTGAHAPALQEVLDGLNDLLQLDHDAMAAYDVAIDKLQDRDHADQIAGFRRDHERHVRELGELVSRLGGTPEDHAHLTGPLKTALQRLGGLGGDRGLLMAFRTNELQVRAKYDAYASKAMLWPPDVKRAIDLAALDEERHYAWVAGLLQRMGSGDGELDAVRGIDAARERANVGGGMIDSARDAVSDAAGAVGGLAANAGDAVADAASSVRDRAGDAAKNVGERVSNVAGSVRQGVTGGVDAVRNRIAGLLNDDEGPLADVQDRAQHVAGSFEGRVREKPLQTLLLAGVAGFVIGRLLR